MSYSSTGPSTTATDIEANQKAFWEELQHYSMGEGCNSKDYILCDTIGNIKYYTPNDESWGAIIAVDDVNKLAKNTNFYEMDDMDYPDSDYAIVIKDGTLVHRFHAY